MHTKGVSKKAHTCRVAGAELGFQQGGAQGNSQEITRLKAGSQHTQTRRSVGGCRAVLRKNRLQFYSCDSVATVSRQRLRVL